MHTQDDVITVRRWMTNDLVPLAQKACLIASISPQIEARHRHMMVVYEAAYEFAFIGAGEELFHLNPEEFQNAWDEAAAELSIKQYRNELEAIK